jgi:hypothetical protein
LTNWRVPGAPPQQAPVVPTTPPGAADLVVFEAGAAGVSPTSVMETDYVVGGLRIENRVAGAYNLWLNGTLSVNGTFGTTITAGVGSVKGTGLLTFNHVETGEFTWNSGVISADVDVTSGTVFEMATGGTKEVAGRMTVFTGYASWDGQGLFQIDGGQFVIASTGDYNVSGLDDHATINVINDGLFEIQGEMTALMGAGKKLQFPGSGWVKNFGNLEFFQGELWTRNFLNSGLLFLEIDTIASLGVGGGGNGWTVLDSTLGSSGISRIDGHGIAHFKGNGVSLQGGTANVMNVIDECPTVQGPGNLIVNDVYQWKVHAAETSSHWSGTGTTQIGTAQAPWGKLILDPEVLTFRLSRPLVNYGTVDWQVHDASGTFELEVSAGGSIDNKAGAELIIISTSQCRQFINKGAGAGSLKNAGLYKTHTQKLIKMNLPYENTGNGIHDSKGSVQNGDTSKLKGGKIQNGAGGQLGFLGGLEHTGGELTSAGRVDVLDGYIFAAGTATFAGGVDGLVLKADTVTQTGGSLAAHAPASDVDGLYTLSGGTALTDGTFTANLFEQLGGTFTSQGRVEVENSYLFSGGTSTFSGGVDGLVLKAAEVTQSGGSLVVNAPTGDIDGLYTLGGGTATVNGGLFAHGFLQTGGTLYVETTFVAESGAGQVAGTTLVSTGVLQAPGGWTVGSYAQLNLFMSSLTGNLTNEGLLTIGPPGSTYPFSEVFTITGNFAQTGSGSLVIDAAASGYERVLISGSATLGGNLTVRTPAGATGGSSYDVLSFASYSGTFASVSLPSGYVWEIVPPPMPGGPSKFRVRQTGGPGPPGPPGP